MFFFIFFSYPNIQTKLKTHVKDYCKLQSVKFFFFLFTLLLFIYFEHKFQLGTLFFEYNRFIILLIAHCNKGLIRIFLKRYSDNKQTRFYSYVISWKIYLRMIKRIFLLFYTVINVIFSALNVPFETIISKIKIFFIKFVAYLTVFCETFVPKTLDRLIRRKGKRSRKKLAHQSKAKSMGMVEKKSRKSS